MATPAHSMSTSTSTNGISRVWNSDASAISFNWGAKMSCNARTVALSAPQYAAASATGTSAKGIWAAPLPVRSV